MLNCALCGNKVLLDDSFLAFPKLQKMAQAYGIISLLTLAGLIGLALLVVLSTHNPDGYFWHPTLRVHFQSPILPSFCFYILNPELQTKEIPDPEKPIGDPLYNFTLSRFAQFAMFFFVDILNMRTKQLKPKNLLIGN